MAKILNFGSINIDYVYRIPRFLQPGETMASEDMQMFAGGKGLNQSIALARAGAEVWHAGRCAKDAKATVELMQDAGVRAEYVDTTAEKSGHAIIQVTDEGQNCIMLFRGANFEIGETWVDEVLSHFSQGDVLVLQNEINDVAVLVEKAHAKGMHIALNPSPIGPELEKIDFSKITWVLMNEIEGQALTGQRKPDKILDHFMAQYPEARVVLTLGELGACYQDQAERCSHGVFKVPVVDTTAAGDTFTGYFIHAVVEGETPERALHIASVASSMAISQQGAAPSIPAKEQVLKNRFYGQAIPGVCKGGAASEN